MKENKLKNSVRYLSIILLSFIMAFPFIWMVLSSIKTKEEVWQFPPSFWPAVPQFHTFLDAWQAAPFGLYMFNSTFTALIIVFIQIINSALMAYAFAVLKFKAKNLVFALIMATYMLPAAATYVPSYIILSHLDMIDSYRGIVISNMVSVFGIFLIRQAFMQIRKEMVEAAQIDGAGHLRILVEIMMPLCKSSFITLGLISFVGNYNNYLWPSLIIKSPKLYMVTQGLRQFFIQGGAYGIKWPQVMAASTFTVLPLIIIFFVCQKWFMKSIGDTGVKG